MSCQSSFMILIFTIVTFLANQYVFSQQQPIFKSVSCDRGSGMTYSTDSPYATNLNTVLTTLQTQSSMSYNTSSGTGTDTAYGEYYCRGDIDANRCSDCIKGATSALNTTCTLAKGASFLSNDCSVSYSNHSMYRVLEADRADLSTGSSAANVSDQTTFPGVLSNTVGEIIDEAVRTSNLFATGEGKVSASETVYCLVQCSPDLSDAQCKTCLETVYGYISTPPRQQWPVLIYAFLPSCRVMYNADSVFYSSTPTPTPRLSVPATSPSVSASSPLTNSQLPTPSASAPTSLFTASQPPSSPSNGGSAIVRRGEVMKVGIVTAVLVSLMLVLNP